MPLTINNLIQLAALLILSSFLNPLTAYAQASCTGCLCPGDPCQLCPLPPSTDDKISENDPETCQRIRADVPPIADLPGSNEYFASLDKSTMACIKHGGDVIKNHRKSPEFPARVYCKPYITPAK